MRFVSGAGASDECLFGRLGEFRHSLVERDLGALGALLADDLVAVDVMSDLRTVFRSVEVDGDIALVRTSDTGVSADGNRSEREAWLVLRLTAGRFDVVEPYTSSDVKAARSRFAHLAGHALRPVVDNAQIRFVVRQQWRSRYAAGDPLLEYADDCVLVDRGSSVNAGEIVGAEEVASSIQSAIDVFGRLDFVPIAVRGDRVTLYRWTFSKEVGFATTALAVIEAGEDLRTTRIEWFDERDLASAVDCLEARHRNLAGDAYTAIEDALARGERAFNRHDPAELDDLFAPGFEVVDHRQLRVSMGREEYLESFRLFVEQLPDVTIGFARLFARGDVALGVMQSLTGATAEGLIYEWAYVQLGEIDGDGRATRFEFYALEQWDEAVARFEEMAPA
jgi:hypothetical protein